MARDWPTSRAGWEQAFESAYLRKWPALVRDAKSITLSEGTDIVRTSDRSLALNLHRAVEGGQGKSGAHENMQTDSAAFEGWAIALKLWLGDELQIDEISLNWTPQVNSANAQLHYERFLYRAHNFQRMFPWFKLSELGNSELLRSEAVTYVPLVTNVPLKPRDVTLPLVGADAPDLAGLTEHQLEMMLCGSEKFKAEMKLDFVDRQLPVGLFRDQISEGTRVFPGNGAAIDLFGTDEKNRLLVFELKKTGNNKVGMVSELLLYVALLHEAIADNGRVRFGRQNELADKLERCTALHGIFLAPRMHPLLNHEGLVSMLDDGAARAWGSTKPVTFESKLIDPEWLRP